MYKEIADVDIELLFYKSIKVSIVANYINVNVINLYFTINNVYKIQGNLNQLYYPLA